MNPIISFIFWIICMISNDARDFVAGKVKQDYRNSNSIHIFFLINLGPTYHQFQLQNISKNDVFQISFRLLLIQVG